MANPLFQTFGGSGNQNNMMGQFHQFMQKMQGKDPNAEIQKLLQSGRISQAQLNQAQQMASQFAGIFKK
mgnify:CR=1 FL=1